MLDIAKAHSFLETFIGVTSLALNVCLLYLIIKHSQFKVPQYKKILLTTCIVDLSLTIITFIGQPALFADRGWMFFLANGYFAGYSELFDHLCCSFYCTSVHVNMICIVTMFIYRYRIVCCAHGEDGRFKNMKVVIGCAILWCMFQSSNAVWMYCFGQSDEYRAAGIDILDRYGWEYDHNMPPWPATSYASQPKNIMHHCIYATSLTVGYTIIFWCESQIMKHLSTDTGTVLRESTRRLHAEVNRALIALAVTPSLTLMGPVLLLLTALILQLTLGPAAAIFSMTMSLITLFNPITTIYFVRPYRRAVVQMFCCRGQGKVSNVTIQSHTTQTEISQTAVSQTKCSNCENNNGVCTAAGNHPAA